MKNLILFIFVLVLISCNSDNAAKTAEPTAPKVTQKTQPQRPQPVQRPQTQQRPASKTVTEANYKAKNDGWLVNMEEAFAESKKTGKPIMANFTGSDWCGWCHRLDASVFHKEEFPKWAKKNVVLLELDFPRRFKLPPSIVTQNRNLQQALGVRGYPTIWLFDADKDATGNITVKPLGKTGYTKTIDEFKKVMGGYIAAR